MKALILAAGLGTRLKPWTLEHPKALALVNGKPLLQRTIEYLQLADINEVIINVHHFADQVIRALEHNGGWGSRYQISNECNLLMDTGGAVMKAAQQGYLSGEKCFVIINADILTDLPLNQLINQQIGSGQLATLAVSNRASSRRLMFDAKTRLLGGWQNIAKGEQILTRQMDHCLYKAFSGIHCMDQNLIQVLANTELYNGKTPFSIIDAYLTLSKDHSIGFFDHSGSKLMDTGTPDRLADAEKVFE